ncbi:DUF3108 domain-containing protein [Shimia marina]|uniref:DUF3108 domain-containing protein n=1 Tax=Shimia marina TaxID=321267 RepID=A0A0P1EUL9_9RHOB|nr:DUF3108 domain-containing protein [Shimia marina]CUH54191.1 hypothetical protein SHM7688_03661 [Shimia marina]SFD97367.1 Protein of unknown function [Shimia marina]
MPRDTCLCLAQRFLRHATLWALLLCAAVMAPPAATAEQITQRWSVHAFGIKVGELRVTMSETAQNYSGKGIFETTGLAGVLKKIRFSIEGGGGLKGSDLLPRAYTGRINTGKRISETSLRRQGDRMVKTKGLQEPDVPIEPSALKGAFDPLSMMWLTLRDQTEETLCTVDQTQFDGTRLVRITLKTRRTSAEGVTCSGTYDRIGGYSAEDLAELKTSPLSIVYQKQGNVWRAQEVHLTSRHGKAKVIRQE